MDIVELAPGDGHLDDVYPVMHELRTELSSEQFVSCTKPAIRTDIASRRCTTTANAALRPATASSSTSSMDACSTWTT
jgi:hypothetical protein